MAPPTIIQEALPEESSSDEDFNPEAQVAEEVDSSSDDDEAIPAPAVAGAKKQGTKRARDDDEIDADLDSGDEVTIQERKKQKKRKKRGAAQDNDAAFISDDEGGEGGFVRTRAQRRTDKVERRALASTHGATINVGDVWSRLSAIPIGRVAEDEPVENEDDYITIKRTTRFAGQINTEERRVPKSSQEARIWLEEQEAEARKKKRKDKEKENEAPVETSNTDTTMVDGVPGEGDIEPKLPQRRPLKRYLKWDPNPLGEVKGLPANLQLYWPRDKTRPNTSTVPTAAPASTTNHRMLPPPLPGAAKLNTVQKSKYDWASYVDKNKLADELDEYGRSKESYAGRTDFLSRIESRKEEERLAAVQKTR